MQLGLNCKLISYLAVLSFFACQTESSSIVTPGDSQGDSDCLPPCSLDGVPPSPWDKLSWTFTEIEVGDPTLPAGLQGRLVRATNGDLYYAYFKLAESQAECNIAAFAGGKAPSPTYLLRVASKPKNATAWAKETVPLEQVGPPNHATAQYGIDATFDAAGHLVLVLAAGGPGLAQCGSTDVIMAKRNGPGDWSVAPALVTGSAACCPVRTSCTAPGLDCCLDPNCTVAGPGDVGAWAAVARADDNTLAVAFTDHHNYWDEDGQNHQGIEYWSSASGVGGIRPWSGLGLYAALIFAGNKPIVAFTGYKSGGLTVLHRPTNAGTGNDWQPVNMGLNDFSGWKIGERIRLAKTSNGAIVGLVFHAQNDGQGRQVHDLIYCESTDAGATWQFPCRRVGVGDAAGGYPSLAYDSQNLPRVAYQSCGADPTCPVADDGVQLAIWDPQKAPAGAWWRFQVHSEKTTSSGQFTQLVIDPETQQPTIAFMHQTRGSAVIAEGHFE